MATDSVSLAFPDPIGNPLFSITILGLPPSSDVLFRSKFVLILEPAAVPEHYLRLGNRTASYTGVVRTSLISIPWPFFTVSLSKNLARDDINTCLARLPARWTAISRWLFFMPPKRLWSGSKARRRKKNKRDLLTFDGTASMVVSQSTRAVVWLRHFVYNELRKCERNFRLLANELPVQELKGYYGTTRCRAGFGRHRTQSN